MTRLRLRPYCPGDDPPAGSVGVSVVVLTLNEEPNIRRCLTSVAWADQVIVVDSGSADATVTIARSLRAEVVEQPWLGFSAQRDFALRIPALRHDWVYFVDADEWVSPQLAAEIADRLRAPAAAAFAHRFRLVFLGTWIRHCGWHRGSWIVRLVDRRYAKFDGSLVGERPQVDGPVLRLANDIVDQDLKGLAAWLHKHVRYAQLEAERRGRPVPLPDRIRALRAAPRRSRPLVRSVLKDVVFPAVPAKPAAIFVYMYLLRLGFLDGLAGLRFCFYHAWFQASVTSLRAESAAAGSAAAGSAAAGSATPPVSAGRPRLGVLATHVIQYQVPLYQELCCRGAVDLEVAFLSDAGARPFHNADFGAAVKWDIDLLGGYRWTLVDHRSPRALACWPFRLIGWLRRQDIVVVHGHADPRMLLAAVACRALRVPYLLRGESHAEPAATGWRRLARHALASFTVRSAAGALPIGQLNAAFYQRYGRIPHFPAPYSVDNDRFGAMADAGPGERTKRLTSLGLSPHLPVVIFSGKFIPRKRPLDVVRAVERCEGRLSLLLLGDGPLREEIRSYEAHLPVRCLGFVNQADLPGWYACGDVLVLPSGDEPWGVVVNEGMACGLVPVVSDAVGCAPDLVEGVGELFAVGDVGALAAALLRAARDAPSRREKIRERLERFTIAETAVGYERAALALHRTRRG